MMTPPFLRMILLGAIALCCCVGGNKQLSQQQQQQRGSTGWTNWGGGGRLRNRLRGGSLAVCRTEEELNKLRRVRTYQRQMATRGSSSRQNGQQGAAARLDPEESSVGDILIEVGGRFRKTSEVEYEELIADGYDPAWDDSECCWREYEVVRQKMMGNIPWGDEDEQSSAAPGDIVDVDSCKVSMSKTPLYMDVFDHGPVFDEKGRRQQKPGNKTISGYPVVPFRELFGEEAEMGSEWDLSVDSKGEVRLDADSGTRSDEVNMGKMRTVDMGDAKSDRMGEADGEKMLDSEDEMVDSEKEGEGEGEGEELEEEERDENGRTESQAITDFFRDPPPGITVHQAVGMSGEEYAHHVEHHLRTGMMYPEKPKSLQGDCRPRLVRFAETLRAGPLRTCVHSLATMASPPPCDRADLLQLAKELPGGSGQGGARHDLGPYLWCAVEGMLRGDAFSTVSRALTDLAKREAELDRGSSKARSPVLDSDTMFLTEREVRDARMDEIRRTPYHLLKINVTDSVTGLVTEQDVKELDTEAQYYVANGGIESREDLCFAVPPEWEDDEELPPRPGDRVFNDGTIWRCPFPNDTVPAGTPYPEMGHWLGNDHEITKRYREYGQQVLLDEDSDEKEDWHLSKTEEKLSAHDRQVQIRKFVEKNKEQLKSEWEAERGAKGSRRGVARMSGSAEEDEEVQRDMLEELAVHGAASRASVKRILPKQEKPKVRGNDNLGKAAVKGPRTLYAAGQQIDPSVFADPI